MNSAELGLWSQQNLDCVLSGISSSLNEGKRVVVEGEVGWGGVGWMSPQPI